MNFRKIATLATAGTVAAGMSVLGLGVNSAFAIDTGPAPVSFNVDAGVLSIVQDILTTTELTQGAAADMPATTVTDGRNEFGRSGAWTVSATKSALSAGVGAGVHTIAASQITIGVKAASGSFANDATGSVVAGGLVSVTTDTIAGSYTYTPTATLATQTLPLAGAYSGTVTQTVV